MIELTNHESANPEKAFLVSKRDIRDALEDEEVLTDIIFWHSHPGGVVGPSRLDMRNRTLFPHHLVISLTEDGIISSWY